MFPKSAILTAEEKFIVRQSLFLYQKNCYEKMGDIASSKRDLIKSIVEKLSLS